MNARRKTRRRFLKINLMETSAVGIPAYPDAHMSFIKALSDYIQINERGFKLNKMSETEQAIVKEEAVAEETPVAPVEEAPAVEEPAPAEESVDEEAEKSVSSEEKLVNLLSKAFEEAIDKSTVKRGLVESKTEIAKEAAQALKDMTVGELAIKSGWFQKI